MDDKVICQEEVEKQDDLTDNLAGVVLDESDEEDIADEDVVDEEQYDNSELVFSEHHGEVFVVCIDKYGRYAASGGQDDKGFVWEIETGKILFEHKGNDSVTCACFNHDSSLVALGDMSGLIKVWNMESKEEIWQFETGDLEWLKWHPATSALMAGTQDGDAWLWKVPSGDCKTYQSPGCSCLCGDFLPDGKKAALGYSDGSVRVFDLKTQQAVHTISKGKYSHREAVNDIACSADGQLILTGSLDGSAKLISMATGKISATYHYKGDEGADHSVEKVGFSSSLPLVATASLDCYATIWDLKTGQTRHKCQHPDGIARMLWSNDGNSLYTGCLDGVCRRWDARSGELMNAFVGHSYQIYDIALSKDDRWLLSTSADLTVRVFDATNMSLPEPRDQAMDG